jgi:hypothetical protein
MADHEMVSAEYHTDNERKPYSPPKLTEFGSLHRVTRGTGGMASDSAENMTKGEQGTSDRSVKENIRRVGTHPWGFGLYLFDFKADHRSAFGVGRQFGVMADEVERVVPDAVSIGPRGYKVVDYAMLGIARLSRSLH